MPKSTPDLVAQIQADAQRWNSLFKSSAAFERVVEQIRQLRYPVLQDRWLSELARIDITSTPTSVAFKEIEALVNAASLTEGSFRISQALSDMSAGIVQRSVTAWADRLADIVNQATSTALVNWQARIQTQSERVADSFIRSKGWRTLPSWTDQQLYWLASRASRETRREFSRTMCSVYRRNRMRALRRQVDGWMDLDSFRDRRGIIQEALLSHRDERYRVAIPSLFPVIDGIAREEFPATRRGIHMSQRVQELLPRSQLEEIETAATLAALDALYETFNPEDTPRYALRLNRHGITHGYLLRYGGEANSLRTFATLDLLHSQALTRRELATPA